MAIRKAYSKASRIEAVRLLGLGEMSDELEAVREDAKARAEAGVPGRVLPANS